MKPVLAKWLGIAALVGALVWIGRAQDGPVEPDSTCSCSPPAPVAQPQRRADSKRLPDRVGLQSPALVDVGSDQCVPCKMMAPILADLRREYKGALAVEFVDVWKNRDEGSKYGVKTIPTQIFYDSRGREIHRHEGFIDKEDILKTFVDHGVRIGARGSKGSKNE